MCTYLDHLIKFLQLPSDIWIQLTSHSVPEILRAFSSNFILIYTSPPPLLGSRSLTNEETRALKLVYG